MTRALTFLSAALAALALAAPASTHSGATLIIRHQVRGCHAWSLNGGLFKAAQTVSLAKGSALTVIDNDVMPQKLVQLSGPAARIASTGTSMPGMRQQFTGPGAMNHMGAAIAVTFPRAGTYVFTTKAGEDYMPGMHTIGEDYVLKLTVKVT